MYIGWEMEDWIAKSVKTKYHQIVRKTKGKNYSSATTSNRIGSKLL